LIAHNLTGINRYLFSVPIIIIAIGFSIYKLNQKMGIISDARRFLQKKTGVQETGNFNSEK
jgi:hypothetical protein